MHVIKAIINKNLSSDFFTQKGWFLLFFFLIFNGVFFYNSINTFMGVQNSYSKLGILSPSTNSIFLSYFGFLQILFIMIVPSLTMNSFAEEVRSKSIRLLLSSPISSIQIVLGKYISSIIMVSIILCKT